jgi:hypothetical protein
MPSRVKLISIASLLGVLFFKSISLVCALEGDTVQSGKSAGKNNGGQGSGKPGRS